jgi:excisionase family DNA binding protein
MRDVINSEECAVLLHCTSELVEEMARAGELPALKIGRNWIFLRADLLVFLAEKARQEALERRSKHAAGPVVPPLPKPRRAPPVLPTVPGETGVPTSPSTRTPASPARLYVTAAEAARMLCIGVSTLWREVKEGTLPKPIKLGSSTRWRVADLQQVGSNEPIPAQGQGVRFDLVR